MWLGSPSYTAEYLHLLHMLSWALEREELADVLTTTLACVSGKSLYLVYQLSWSEARLETLRAEMIHFHGSFQWSYLKGNDVTFGEVLSQSPLFALVCILSGSLQSLDPLTVDALCFLVVISAQQKGKQLLNGMSWCQMLFYSPDLKDCVCEQTHSENI